MFKLYINREMVNKCESEQDIIYTMNDYLKEDPETRFLLKEESKEKGDSIKWINGLLDYALYVEEYNTKLKQMSCVELKREIVKKKVKIK